MIVKVLGIGRSNRGAELMLEAVTQFVRASWGTDCRVLTRTSSDRFVKSFLQLARHCPVLLMPYRFADLPSMLPRWFRSFFGVVADADVSVVFDASGFAYGDAWGVSKLRERVVYSIATLKARGTFFYVLPQAFGPFVSIGFSRSLEILVSQADYVFVRDRESYGHLVSAVGQRSNVLLAPDITIGLQAKTHLLHTEGDLAVVPNWKILESSVAESEEDYVLFLCSTIELAQGRGYRPFLLNHEGLSDLALIHKVSARLSGAIPVVSGLDALTLKGVLGACRLVVSSRFHAIVSALSQGVPTIAVGWSHKYDELLADFGVSELAVPLNVDAVGEAIDFVEANRDVVRQLLKHQVAARRKDVSGMWDIISASMGVKSGCT